MELIPAFLVGAGVLGGGFALVRAMFSGAGATKQEPLIRLPDKRYRRILVPTGVGMCHTDYVTEAASLACNLASRKGSSATEIIFTYVIPVPRALPVTAQMPEEEVEAQRVLDAAAAAAHKCGITNVTTQLRKGRTVVDETVKAVEQEDADLVILTPQTHLVAEMAVPLAIKENDTVVPATRANCPQTMLADGSLVSSKKAKNTSRCFAELDTTETSDQSETLTGKLLRRIPCEAMVARPAIFASSLPQATTPAFSRN